MRHSGESKVGRIGNSNSKLSHGSVRLTRVSASCTIRRPPIFNEHIIKPWRTRSDPKAVEKLRKPIKAVAIRRSKKLLGLPARDDQVHHVEFSEDERTRYEKIRLRIRDDAFDLTAPIFAHILWIDDLRGLCSHSGELMRASRSSMHLPSTNTAGSPLQPSAAVDFDQMSFLLSDNLLATINQDMDLCERANISNILTDGVDDRQELSPSWRSSRKCPYQWPLNRSLSTPDASGCNSPSLASPVDSDHAPVSSSQVSASYQISPRTTAMRSFSHSGTRLWTRFPAPLRIADGALCGSTAPCPTVRGIPHLMRSGQNASIKVLLATVSAAGLGLDITVANLACLLEPQWSPSTEEQVLSRVHRMRQTKRVKRYGVRNAIEENIIELQQRKLRLAQLALNGEGEAIGKGLMDDLKMLLK
ncbi:uncharacterized protein Z519_03963 [Cladophialophora bantiana CBS 173.52]|uniref:Helicase C-terminal domain-containing protein n=1 Tax=Cladophialophora bantiana (strain ATCC 10958 / CBS 173.52 / CDC B-1940 / NIH 8579) TaxID=1442370 RepID=A0A0D2IF26_CLAB1|nr:uncharacterized protein Z519_03963 [Cladophialophora bantiana CBS 173.52]KIW95379.1 hypothetical protein Z519_03963 [Cladophialophora bantiana CBS 173.52]